MSKIVSLNRARKDRARAEKRAAGDANAAKHGRTKAAKRAEAQAADKARRHVDGHKREE